MYSPV